MRWCLQPDTLTLRQRPRSFHAVALLRHALEAFDREHRCCGDLDGGVRGRPRLDVLPESGRSAVVKVGKAPRGRLPTDGVSRTAEVGWWPTLDRALIDPPRRPRYRWRT